jgi:hypothetical protein
MVDVEKMKLYWDLPESEIIKYAMCINVDYKKFNIKKNNKINRSELAIKYNEMIKRGDCKNYADLARIMNVSRAWVTKIMKHLPVK